MSLEGGVKPRRSTWIRPERKPALQRQQQRNKERSLLLYYCCLLSAARASRREVEAQVASVESRKRRGHRDISRPRVIMMRFFIGTLLLLHVQETLAFVPALPRIHHHRQHCITPTRIQDNTSTRDASPSLLFAVSKETHDAFLTTSCKTAIASALMSLALLCGDYSQQSLLHSFTPPAAFAIEQVIVQVSGESSSVAATVDPTDIQQKSPQELVGIPPLPKQEQQVSEVLQPVTTISTPVSQESSYSVVDEVWTLVNKYFIDRSFHGQVRVLL